MWFRQVNHGRIGIEMKKYWSSFGFCKGRMRTDGRGHQDSRLGG